MLDADESWDRNIPEGLRSAVEHLREAFDTGHWEAGEVTKRFCFSLLHPGTPNDMVSEYEVPLQHLKRYAGGSATTGLTNLLKQGTLPATFKAFFNFYLDCMANQALAIFSDLTKIGHANQSSLKLPYLKWAEEETKYLIRLKKHVIIIWIRDVCDVHRHDPDEDLEERAFWRNWRAPLLLLMKPSRMMEYEADRVWERADAEKSQQWLKLFSEHYVIHLESRLREVAGDAAVRLAQGPTEVGTNAAPPANPFDHSAVKPRARASRIDLRKRATQAKYREWHKAYRLLKQKNPDKSDVWVSKRIAGMEIGAGSSPETIRKNMKR